MGVNTHENDTGAVDFVNDGDGHHELKLGGPTTPSVAYPRWLGQICAKMPITGGVSDTGGGLLSWPNPFPYAIIIDEFVIDVTTVATGTCGVEVGTTATSGTTTASNLITSQDVHTATGTYNSGLKSVKLAVGSFLTVSSASGTSTGLVANGYVSFTNA
jgi:hypothetical protein